MKPDKTELGVMAQFVELVSHWLQSTGDLLLCLQSDFYKYKASQSFFVSFKMHIKNKNCKKKNGACFLFIVIILR